MSWRLLELSFSPNGLVLLLSYHPVDDAVNPLSGMDRHPIVLFSVVVF
jgi:hypothetical protein